MPSFCRSLITTLSQMVHKIPVRSRHIVFFTLIIFLNFSVFFVYTTSLIYWIYLVLLPPRKQSLVIAWSCKNWRNCKAPIGRSISRCDLRKWTKHFDQFGHRSVDTRHSFWPADAQVGECRLQGVQISLAQGNAFFEEMWIIILIIFLRF